MFASLQFFFIVFGP